MTGETLERTLEKSRPMDEKDAVAVPQARPVQAQKTRDDHGEWRSSHGRRSSWHSRHRRTALLWGVMGFGLLAIVWASLTVSPPSLQPLPEPGESSAPSPTAGPARPPWPGGAQLVAIEQLRRHQVASQADLAALDGDGARFLGLMAQLTQGPGPDDESLRRLFDRMVRAPRYFLCSYALREYELSRPKRPVPPLGASPFDAQFRLAGPLAAKGTPPLTGRLIAALEELLVGYILRTATDPGANEGSRRTWSQLLEAYRLFVRLHSRRVQDANQRHILLVEAAALMTALEERYGEGHVLSGNLAAVIRYDTLCVHHGQNATTLKASVTAHVGEVARRAEALSLKWPATASLPVGVEAAVFCRRVALWRQFRHASLQTKLSSIGVGPEVPAVSNSVLRACEAFFDRYDSPRYRPVVHAAFLGQWIGTELSLTRLGQATQQMTRKRIARWGT